ncbi:hypothetical protein GLYMA_04G214800v4 [Glycine max]|nr:hypothetical protein GLYMA_04G214800v4 [Glycine max]KAH1112518.1 hypothetical protein GYH30_010673 [Glycine max]
MIPQDFGVHHSPTLLTTIEVEKTNICLICGDKGDLKSLIYCDQCKACAEHRGQFILNKATDFGLVAYASSKACSKVLSAVTVLPTLLDVEILSRFAIWPKSFDMFPPNSDNIGLYFFPLYERDELSFDRVLNDIIEQEFALKAVINNVELLIFSSHLLPPNDRRICEKYYLWGAFKPKPMSGNIQSS